MRICISVVPSLAWVWGGGARAESIDPVAVLTQIHGVVAVSKGQAFIQAHKVMLLGPGDSVLALDGGEATVLYSGGCSEHISSNMMLTLGQDGQCREDAEAVEVGPLYASALGAVPDTPRKPGKNHKSGQHKSSSERARPSVSHGAIGSGQPNNSSSEKRAESPVTKDVTPTVTMPPSISQLPTATKPTPESAVAKNVEMPAVTPPPNGPVMVVPDVILDEGENSANEMAAKATAPRTTTSPEATLSRPAPTDGVERAPASQGSIEITQALAASAKDRDNKKEVSMDERERARTPVAAPIVPAPIAEKPAAGAAGVTTTPATPAAPAASKETAESKAAKRWRLGAEEEELDGPRMVTGGE
ncbi:MAG: hypothetical protein AABY83_13160 [Pseudomonadota bacterium]